MMRAASMVEATPRVTSQNARKQRNDRLVRRLTTTATTFAIGLAGVFAGFSASALPPHRTATQIDKPGPDADAALAKAIADYAAAAAPRHSVAPSRPGAVTAPRPAAPRRPAVAVSGGS
jgi:hypothetical protein